eukprot:1259090-Pyramimonas_sp.AAC.1
MSSAQDGCKPASTDVKEREFPAFPFKPYAIQQKFMSTLYDTLEDGGVGILESPTGTMIYNRPSDYDFRSRWWLFVFSRPPSRRTLPMSQVPRFRGYSTV